MANTAPATKKSNKGRKSAAIALAIVGVAGLSLASAAQLTVNDSSLGAGNSIVTSCQPVGTPITVSYTSGFVAGTLATGTYKTTAVNLGAIVPACGGKTLNLTVVDSTGAVLATAAAVTLPATPLNPTVVTITGTDAKLISGVSVVISG
jgi:hypothetical protein